MRVRMKVDISGARDGKPWPARGEVADLPDDEAAGLCESGMAEPVAERDKAEKAVPTDDSEKRAEGGRSDQKADEPAKRSSGRSRKPQE